MSAQAVSWAWKQRTGDPEQKALLMALAQYSDLSGRCWIRSDGLAEITEMSKSTVVLLLQHLVEGQFLRYEYHESAQWFYVTLNFGRSAA